MFDVEKDIRGERGGLNQKTFCLRFNRSLLFDGMMTLAGLCGNDQSEHLWCLKANSGVRKSVGREAYYAQTGLYVWCKYNSDIKASKSFKLNWKFDYAKWVFLLKSNMQIIQIHLLQQVTMPKLSVFPFVSVKFSTNHSDLRLLKVWTRDFEVQINPSWISRESVAS